jgi:hypothetical protein
VFSPMFSLFSKVKTANCTEKHWWKHLDAICTFAVCCKSSESS